MRVLHPIRMERYYVDVGPSTDSSCPDTSDPVTQRLRRLWREIRLWSARQLLRIPRAHIHPPLASCLGADGHGRPYRSSRSQRAARTNRRSMN